MTSEKKAGYKFAAEDAHGIYQTADTDIQFFQPAAQWTDEAGKSIDREHPDRSTADQLLSFIRSRAEAGKNNLHTPAQNSTYNKFFLHIC